MNNQRLISCSIVLAGLLYIVWWSSNKLWSNSVDLAHHYALVRILMDHAPFRHEWFPNLDEMNYYPPLSHYVAARLAALFESGFTAMLAVGMASLFVAYAAIICMAARATVPGAAIAAVTLIALATASWPVHGSELRVNYFYSQVFATALGYTVFLWASGRRGALMTDALTFLACIVVGFAHLIAGLQLFAAYGMLILVEAIRFKPARYRAAAWSVAGLAFLGLHPSVSAMMKIGSHEGGLVFYVADTLGSQVALVGAGIIIGTTCILFGEAKKRQPMVALGCLLFASAALSLSMLAAFMYAGIGSNYGFKKTLFSVVTLIPVALCSFLPEWRAGPRAAIASMGAVVVTLAVMGVPLVDAGRIELLRSAVEHSGYKIAVGNHTQPVTIVGFPELVPSLNYLLTIGELGVPRDERGMAVYFNDYSAVMGVEAVLTDRMEKCPSQPVGPIFRVPFDCWVANR